jgi:hypothetical protein
MRTRIRALGLVAVLTLACLDGRNRRHFATAAAHTILATETAELPVTRCGSRFVAHAMVDGVGPFRFIIDTGSSANFVGSRMVEAAKLASTAVRVAVGTVGGRRRLDRAAHVATLRLGALEISDFDALVYETPTDGGGDVSAYDGVLGMSAFSSVTLTMDFRNGRVQAARAPLAAGESTSLFDFSTGVPVMWASWGEFAAPVVIDTGFSGEFALPRSGDWQFATAPGVRARSGRLGGDVLLGTLVLAQPSVRLTAHPALVGTDALRDVVLTLDARSRHVRFEGPRTIAARPVHGIGVSFREYKESWKIESVFDDTPASRAGLREGDRVVAIDTSPVGTFACGKWEERLRSSLAVRLDVERDGEPLEFMVGSTKLVD